MSFVVVHAGCGYHSPKNHETYNRLCQGACAAAMKRMREVEEEQATKQNARDGPAPEPDHRNGFTHTNGPNSGGTAAAAAAAATTTTSSSGSVFSASIQELTAAVEGVVAAVEFLENDVRTNAGIGSNLTLCGRVECDASVMDGRSLHWAGIGAAGRLKNPVCAARALLDRQSHPMPCGLLMPNLLVGEGATTWALEEGACEPCDVLATEQSRTNHASYKALLEKAIERQRQTATSNSDSNNDSTGPLASGPHKRNLQDIGQDQDSKSADEDGEDDNDDNDDNDLKRSASSEALTAAAKMARLDTVGAVAIDSAGNIAAACSSGGIHLKRSGRVGQAATFGAGCWADGAVGLATTGAGEYLMKTLLARNVAADLKVATSTAATAAIGHHSTTHNKGHSHNSHLGDRPPFSCLDALSASITRNFLTSPFLAAIPKNTNRSVGLVGLILQDREPFNGQNVRSQSRDTNNVVTINHHQQQPPPPWPQHDHKKRNAELFYAHSTASLSLGYMSAGMREPVGFVSINSHPVSTTSTEGRVRLAGIPLSTTVFSDSAESSATR